MGKGRGGRGREGRGGRGGEEGKRRNGNGPDQVREEIVAHSLLLFTHFTSVDVHEN